MGQEAGKTSRFVAGPALSRVFADDAHAPGLSHPSLVVLIIAKHFSYAGKEEFNLAMVEHEYQRFARTQLAGSGRARWSTGILEVVSTIGSCVPCQLNLRHCA